jgi:6-pyruvoyltetrahydropterin/6-carboxytetrahydropterin synthase
LYEVAVEISFLAKHQLRLGSGGLEELHEHNWRVRLELEGENLSPDGLLIDFVKVKKILAEIADKLDGKSLADVIELADKNPSAENLAYYFHQQLKGRFDMGVRLTQVAVEEAPGCWAAYRA